MKESLRKKREAIALTLVLGLGISACGSTATAKPVVKSGLSVHDKYFTNGTREIFVEGEDSQGYTGAHIFEFCDGRDLVEETLVGYGAGGSVSRSVNYPGCADGKLTPSDFQLHPTTATTAK